MTGTERIIKAKDSPFISERSLRKIVSKNGSSTPYKPAKQQDISHLHNIKLEFIQKDLAQIGYHDMNGIRWGVPLHLGESFYFYDTNAPPDFSLRAATQVTTQSNSVGSVTHSEVKIDTIVAPPFPEWAINGTDPSKSSSAAEKKPLVIKRNAVNSTNNKEPAPVTGWQAIMAEMNKRKDKGLKKVEAPAPAAKETAKAAKKGVKKKGGKKEFKDVMEELSYKLAKLRGEVMESDDEGDGTDEPADTTTGTSSASSIKEKVAPPAASPAVPNPSIKKLSNKPDLLSLLAKIKPPTAAVPVVLEPTPVITSSVEIVTYAMAVAAPAVVPRPPPVPNTVWPPVAHYVEPPIPSAAPQTTDEGAQSTTTVNNISTSGSNNGSNSTTNNVVTTLTAGGLNLPLFPFGFYIPQPTPQLVPPGGYVFGGTVDQSLINSRLVSSLTDTDLLPLPDDIPSIVTAEPVLSKLNGGKISMNDLPLPSDFHASVERMNRAYEIRNQRALIEKSLELRQHEPTRKKQTADPAMNKQKIVPYVSNVDVRMSTKTGTYRKPMATTTQSTDDMYATSNSYNSNNNNNNNNSRSHSPSILNSTLYHEISADIPTAAWINELRNNTPSKHSHTYNINNNTHNSNSQHKLSTTTTINNNSNNNIRSDTAARTPIKPQQPEFLSDKLLSRRQASRAERQQLQQAEAAAQERLLKQHKEELRLKALRTAQEMGVYKPTTRFRQVQKTIEKYSNRSDVGVNLELLARKSQEEFLTRNSAFSRANESLLQHQQYLQQLQQQQFYSQQSPYYHQQAQPHQTQQQQGYQQSGYYTPQQSSQYSPQVLQQNENLYYTQHNTLNGNMGHVMAGTTNKQYSF